MQAGKYSVHVEFRCQQKQTVQIKSLKTIAAIAYMHDIKKIPFAVASRRVLRYSVNKTTLAKRANVESPDKILLFEKMIEKKSPRE
jgi:hypothetical protein